MMKYAYRECLRKCSRPGFFRAQLSIGMGREKFEYFLVSGLGLVGKKQMARVLEKDEFCARNSRCDQLAIAGGHQCIRFSVDDQRRRCDLSNPAIAFPRQYSLQLRRVAFQGGPPAPAEGEIFFDF